MLVSKKSLQIIMLSRCRTHRYICHKPYTIHIYQSIIYFSDFVQPEPWNNHPNPNPFDHAQRYTRHKRFVSPPDPKPFKTTEPYIDMNQKHHLPRYPRNQIGRNKKQQFLQQTSPLYLEDSTSLSLQPIADNKYIASNPLIALPDPEPPSTYLIDPKKRKSFGIIDDQSSYKQIRKKLELIIRQSKSTDFNRKGLDGIISLSRKFQRLLDQAELLETPKYAFPLFDEIFFAFQKYGIMSDRPYNQMIVQCERREMYSRCIGVLKRMLDGSIRPTSYTLNFMIRCLAKGKEYDALQQLFEIWKEFGLSDKTRMEYWHLRNLLNLLIENNAQHLVSKYLTLTHELQLLEYKEGHSDLMQYKDYEIQQQIMRKLCFYGVQNVKQMNEWMHFITSHWDMNQITIPNTVVSKLLYWNEIDSLSGMHDICNELNIDPNTIVIDETIIASILGNMKRKSNQQFAQTNTYRYSIVDALDLFNYALEHHADTFTPNIACFNQLFAMIKSQNEIRIAKELLQDMKRNYPQIKPNKETAIHLIRLLYYNPTDMNMNTNNEAHILEQKSGHQMLNELIQMGLQCNPIHQDIYHELIQLHAFYADFTGFLLTLYKMKAENEMDDELMVTQMQNDAYDDDEMEMIADKVNAQVNKIDINEHTFEPIIEPILLNKLAVNGDVKNCCLVLDEMIQCQYRPSGPVYRDIIEAMGKYGYGQQALQMIDRAVLDGMVFSDRIWRYWMLSFAKYGQIESCLMFLDKMDRSNNIRSITTRHFNGLLYAYYQNNDLDGIRKTYDYMIHVNQQRNTVDADGLHQSMKMNIKPDIKSYHIIARAYLENGDAQALKQLLESMEYHDIGLDWKMYSIALQSMLQETDDVTWDNVQQYLSSVIHTKKVFPRQPMVDDVLSASIQLERLDQGLSFMHQAFDDPDLRTSTLPTESKLGEFITHMWLNTHRDVYYHSLYRGMLAYLTEQYQHIYSILSTKTPRKAQQEALNAQQKLLIEQKKYLGNFRFRPRRLLQHVLLTLNEYFDPLTCTMNVTQYDDDENRYNERLDCRQLLVDILRHLCAPMDELKAIKIARNKHQHNKSEDESLSKASDEQLLSAYFAMIEEILSESVKQHPNLILLASSQLSIPIKPALFTKMIHSLVFNGEVESVRAMASIIDEYYNSNAANPYIEYFEYDEGDKPVKPWLVSSKTEWRFVPHQMIDSEELERVGMKISDLILFDALLYDKQLDEALAHLSVLHKQRKISFIIMKQIIQRTLNYMQQTDELKVNDKQYVSKVTHVLTQILKQMPRISDADDDHSMSKHKKEKAKKRKQIQQTNELFECIWNENGFTRGAIILQGLLIKLDAKHCLKPYLQSFCVTQFSKLTQYGLLEPETDAQTLALHTQQQSLLAK
eukprot:792549_1